MSKGGKGGLGITILLPFISTLTAGLNLTYPWKNKKSIPAPASPFTSAGAVSEHTQLNFPEAVTTGRV